MITDAVHVQIRGTDQRYKRVELARRVPFEIRLHILHRKVQDVLVLLRTADKELMAEVNIRCNLCLTVLLVAAILNLFCERVCCRGRECGSSGNIKNI